MQEKQENKQRFCRQTNRSKQTGQSVHVHVHEMTKLMYMPCHAMQCDECRAVHGQKWIKGIDEQHVNPQCHPIQHEA